ncbi:MAG: DnaJ domain-containing protein, partial [Deltaproteobacteria bacterium]|nr:DnaJ domain-containing protein [Deltaproteobacteria bacterium]
MAHLLLYVQQRELNGTLVIWAEQGTHPDKKGQDRLRFENGKAVAGRFVQAGSTFARSMLPLFNRVHAPYAFYDRDLVGTGASVLTSEIEPSALIAASLRGAAREDAIDAVLRRLGQMFVRIRKDADIEALGLNAREKNFVDLIRADATTAAQLVEISGDERRARRLIYLLTITRCVESFKKDDDGGVDGTNKFGAVSVPPGSKRPSETPPFSSIPAPGGGSGSVPRGGRASARPNVSEPPRASQRPSAPDKTPPPPKGLSPELSARWKEIGDFADNLDTMNYFDMLGVKSTIKGSAVTDAYFAKVKKWHPDRLPKELAALKPFADMIFHHLTRAKDTLSDEEDRAVYQRNVAEGGGTPESERQVSAIIESAMAVQRAEVLLKQSDWGGALTLAEEAQELSPDNGESLAIEAWCRFQLQHGKAPYDAILELLKRSIEVNKNSQKAHFYR